MTTEQDSKAATVDLVRRIIGLVVRNSSKGALARIEIMQIIHEARAQALKEAAEVLDRDALDLQLMDNLGMAYGVKRAARSVRALSPTTATTFEKEKAL